MSVCGAIRRAMSTQLVGNPVDAHYRRHVTPGVCRRGGTFRRGSPGLSITWSDRKRGTPARIRRGLLEPEGFLLIAWLARARAVPQSHTYPIRRVRERRCAAARGAGRTLRTALDRGQRSVVWRRRPAADQRQAPAPCNFKGRSRAAGVAAPQRIRGWPPHRATLRASRARQRRGDPAGCARRKLCPSECAVCGAGRRYSSPDYVPEGTSC